MKRVLLVAVALVQATANVLADEATDGTSFYVVHVVPDGGFITWPEAKEAAENEQVVLMVGGVPRAIRGHLVCLETEAENSLVYDHVKASQAPEWAPHVSADHFWLGGFQPDGVEDKATADDRWKWVNGNRIPRKGEGPAQGLYENSRKSPSEPSNEYSSENKYGVLAGGVTWEEALHFAPDGSHWNDLPRTAKLRGYVTEFELPEGSR